MTPSLEGWPTKAKEAPSSLEVRLAPPDTNPVFQSLGAKRRILILLPYREKLKNQILLPYREKLKNQSLREDFAVL